MEETSSDQLINLLKEHKLDFTFSCDESVIQEFENYESFSDHILLALPSDFALPETLLSKALSAGDVAAGRHLAKDAAQVELSDFPEIPFIAIDAHINLGARSLKIFEETGVNPKRYIEVPQLVTACRHRCLLLERPPCRRDRAAHPFLYIPLPLRHPPLPPAPAARILYTGGGEGIHKVVKNE